MTGFIQLEESTLVCYKKYCTGYMFSKTFPVNFYNSWHMSSTVPDIGTLSLIRNLHGTVDGSKYTNITLILVESSPVDLPTEDPHSSCRRNSEVR